VPSREQFWNTRNANDSLGTVLRTSSGYHCAAGPTPGPVRPSTAKPTSNTPLTAIHHIRHGTKQAAGMYEFHATKRAARLTFSRALWVAGKAYGDRSIISA